jgi:large subunit ribosomal protein L22
MTGPKLNEQPVLRRRPGGPARAVEASGTASRAVARYVRMSPYKVRQVLDLVRGHDIERAEEILRFCERDAASLVAKVLHSAVANAEHNQQLSGEELYVAACYADEGPTLKRWRPRARGRATRIRKRTCHVTIIVSRLPEEEVRKRRAARVPTADRERRRRRTTTTPSPERERRVRASRRSQPEEPPPTTEVEEAPAPPADSDATGPTMETAATEPSTEPAGTDENERDE